MSFSKIFLCCCISFIFGIAISAFIPPEKISADFLFYLYILFLGIISFLIFGRLNKIFKISLLLLIFFILGFWRYQISWPKTVENRIESYYNENLTFTGIVVGEPEEGQDNQRLVVKITNVQQKSVTGKILVTAPLYPQYNYADKLKVTCKIKKPEKFNDFFYDKYLAISDIYAICGFPQIDLIANGQGNKLYQKILNFKKKLKLMILENLAEPEASFLSAFLLGYKNDLNKTLFDNFAKTGLAHVIAISGQHITIIFALLLSFFISLGFYRQQAFYFISLFLIFYVIIIGAPASAVRAIIMGELLLLAMHLGRLNKSDRAIALAGGLMLAVNPKFIFDAGFQLSFASVLGIIYIYQLLKERFNKLPSFFGLRDIIFITIAAQIAVLPLSLYYFKRLPLVSLLANILVLPVLSLVISLGLVSLLLGFIYSPLAKILFWFLWLILAYIIKVVECLVILPFSYLGIDSFPWWGAIICYIIFIGILGYLRFQASKNKTRIKNQEL